LRSLTLAIALLVCIGHSAHARQANIYVRPFRGPVADPMRAAVEDCLRKKNHVVQDEAAADSTIEGIVAKKGRGLKLSLTVRDAHTGSAVDMVTFSLASAAFDAAARARVADKLSVLIRAIAAAHHAATADVPTVRTPPGEGALAAGPRAKSRKSPVAVDSILAEAGIEPTTPTRADTPRTVADLRASEPRPDSSAQDLRSPPLARTKPIDSDAAPSAATRAPREPGGPDVFALDAGGGMLIRDFQARGMPPLPTYHSSAYPSLHVAMATYPFARMSPWLGVFGLAGSFEHAVGLRTRTQDGSTHYDTSADRLEGGVQLRFHFGRTLGPTFIPLARYGYDSFEIGGPTDMPNTEYKYLGVGGRLELPLFTAALSAFGEGQYQFMYTIGDLRRLGLQSQAHGVSLEAGLRVRLPASFRLDFTFVEITRHAEFRGDSPVGKTANSASDQFLGGRLTLGVAL
jgi:hypothetical protein